MAEVLTEHPVLPTSLYADEPLSNQMGPSGVRSTMLNARGVQLATYWWPAVTDKPRAIIQLCHGNGAYCMEFLRSLGPGKPLQYEGSWIQAWNRAGVSVCGHDYQGNGFSKNLRCMRSFFESFYELLADVLQLRESMSSAPALCFEGAPVFLTGISLGGCLTLETMLRNPDRWRGAVLLAPMISLEKVAKAGLNPYLMPLSRLVSWLFPAWQVAKVNRNLLYPDLQMEWDSDPLNFQGNTRARSAAEYMRATRELLPRLSETDFSWLCLHGDSDTLCDIDGSHLLLEKSKSKDKELVVLKNRWHVLIKEPGHEEVRDKVLGWVLERA